MKIFLMPIISTILALNGELAHATITGGGVTSGGGTFQELSVPFTESTPDNTVGVDNFQSLNLYAFNEDQNIDIEYKSSS